MANSPQLKTYTVTSKTMPDIREEIDIIERENTNCTQVITDYFNELYGSKNISVSVNGLVVTVELVL